MSVCGDGQPLERIIAIPGKDGKDGVFDPEQVEVKPEPELSDDLVIVDGGVVKRSPWSAFKARIAVWLEDVTASWSNKTLVNPQVQGALGFDVANEPDEHITVSALRQANGNLIFRFRKADGSVLFSFAQNGGPDYTGRFVFTMEEVNGTGRVQVFSPSGNTGITLNPQGSGNINLNTQSGQVLVNGVPVVTTTGVQTVSNKTLNTSTLNSPTLNSPTLIGKTIPFEDAGKTVFAVRSWASAEPVGYFEVRPASSADPAAVKSVRLGVESDSLADVGIQLVTKGSGWVTINNNQPVSVKANVPASATAPGRPGQWAEDDTHLYIYTGDGTAHAWRRAALSTW